jgi:hypothetical protein
MSERLRIPFVEILKSIPGTFGIRLEEQPKFDVVETLTDGVEVRRYARALVAEVTVGSDHDDAVDEGFERLARYIFGENAGREVLPMTSPVTQRGDRLPMTTPVTQRPEDGAWTIAFFLSNADRASDAPRPNDPAVRLVEHPARLLAAARYSGNNTEPRREAARTRLLEALASSGFQPVEGVHWAQYDAPFAVPFLKRNEALVEVIPGSAANPSPGRSDERP